MVRLRVSDKTTVTARRRRTVIGYKDSEYTIVVYAVPNEETGRLVTPDIAALSGTV